MCSLNDITRGGLALSNRPWLSRQTGPINSGVTKNFGPLDIKQIEPYFFSYGSMVPSPFHSLLSSLPFCKFVPRSLLSPPSLPFAC